MGNILIVDDKEENVYYLEALLKGHGWNVSTARHGAEALVKARQAPPDVIVSDLLMPVMDGYTLLRHWKADQRLSSVPFIVYTATYTEKEDERLAYDLGADAFILKPMEPEDFLKRLNEVCTQIRAGTSKKAATPTDDEATTLKHYSETLIRKLEEKSLQLEESNRALVRDQAELVIRDRAISAVSQGILISDANQTDLPIIYASPGFKIITGYECSEIIGKNCRMLQGAETDPATVEHVRNALASGEGCKVEILNYRKDGKTFWNSLEISPVVDAAGKLTHFVGVISDITERRKLEHQMNQSRKLDAIGSLAGGVAHDFNNILAAIGLHVENLLDQVHESDPARKGLNAVLSAQRRGASLTRQLLAFSRKQSMDLTPIDVDKVIEGLIEMLTRLIGENIELKTNFHPGSKIVMANLGQLEQLLMNLVVNSRDAIETNGTITISTSAVTFDKKTPILGQRAREGKYVKISIADTGCGMDEETLNRIFEPFFTTKEVDKGTGLGLPTVHGIVKQCNGYIDVDSSVGKGTSFHIYLPAATTPAADKKDSAAEVIKKSEGQTILVVEDQAELRAILASTLRKVEYVVLEAGNGEEALAIYKSHGAKIDLVITDVVMPVMGGRELSEQIQKINPNAHFLFLSGYTDDTLLLFGDAGTGTRFLDKPFSISTLLNKVREILGS